MAALCRELGISRVMELGGWKSYVMVLRYAHWAPEHLSAADLPEGRRLVGSDVGWRTMLGVARRHRRQIQALQAVEGPSWSSCEGPLSFLCPIQMKSLGRVFAMSIVLADRCLQLRYAGDFAGAAVLN